MIFARYNNYRSPEFRIETLIYEENNTKVVKKRSQSVKSLAHIKSIENNYNYLKEELKNSDIKLPDIITSDENSLTYKYVQGKSLESMMLDAFFERNEEKFIELVDLYFNLLKNSFKTSDVLNIHENEKFFFCNDINLEILKESKDFLSKSFIDFIPSNIIISESSKYLIDHEWLFNSSFPIEYIFIRGLKLTFYDKFSIHKITDFISLDFFYNEYSISKEFVRECEKIEWNFIFIFPNQSFLNIRHISDRMILLKILIYIIIILKSNWIFLQLS